MMFTILFKKAVRYMIYFRTISIKIVFKKFFLTIKKGEHEQSAKCIYSSGNFIPRQCCVNVGVPQTETIMSPHANQEAVSFLNKSLISCLVVNFS